MAYDWSLLANNLLYKCRGVTLFYGVKFGRSAKLYASRIFSSLSEIFMAQLEFRCNTARGGTCKNPVRVEFHVESELGIKNSVASRIRELFSRERPGAGT